MFDRNITKRYKRRLIKYLSLAFYRNLATTELSSSFSPFFISLSITSFLFCICNHIYIFSQLLKSKVAFCTLYTSLFSHYCLALSIFFTLFWALVHTFLYFFRNRVLIIFSSLSQPGVLNCLRLLCKPSIPVKSHARLVKLLEVLNNVKTARWLILSNANSSIDDKIE